MQKLKKYVVLDLEGEEILDTFETEKDAVIWSIMYDGTFEATSEYLQRVGEE